MEVMGPFLGALKRRQTYFSSNTPAEGSINSNKPTNGIELRDVEKILRKRRVAVLRRSHGEGLGGAPGCGLFWGGHEAKVSASVVWRM